MKLILASASPRRKEILLHFGLKFNVCPSDIEEKAQMCEPPQDMVKRLAVLKARAVAKEEKGLILAADTIVTFEGERLGKPKDETEAKLMLKKLVGNTHKVFTGFALLNTETDELISDVDLTEVTFKNLDDKKIDEYIKKVHVLDKAGAYAIQESADLILEKIEGDFYNVMGLPKKAVDKAIELLHDLK